MKRQRNTQQVKEQDKCPPNQTKEEEIGNLPDKEFWIMIVKLIQNLEIKMESQINSLETKIKKFLKRWDYQTTWPASWEICIQVKKQQLESDIEQQTGSKLGKEYIKAV